VSAETRQHLNTYVLIGNTDKRGFAWHHDPTLQSDEPNHYPGFIPIEDVVRRLFDWEPLTGDVTSTAISLDGVLQVKDPSRKAILRPPGVLGADDQGGIMGIFTQGYQGHSYKQWLLAEVANILDDGLGITAAALLAQAGVAFVEVSVPDTVTTPSGIEFRPNLLAATSYNGSLSTTYKKTANNSVCDNTMAVALRFVGEVFRVRHTRHSTLKLAEVRDALAIVHTMAEEFTEQVEQLTNVSVSEGDWAAFLDSLAPIPEAQGRGRTMALNKRDALERLWNSDPRVAPWRNTAWGTIQAVNTYSHHLESVRGKSRQERNMLRSITGEFEKLDASTLQTLQVATA
jgi:phage/plasmid-like protein (TIGR03299 family)